MRIRTVFLLVIALLMAAGGVQAGQRSGAVSLSPFVGGYVFEGDPYDDSYIAGLNLGYAITDRFSAEASYGAIPTESNQDKGDTLGHLYRLEALYHFPWSERVVPFLAGGVGGISYDHDDDDTDSYGLFNYGAGLKYFLTDSLALRGDIRHLLLSEDEPRHNLLATVGITYLLGGEKEEVVEMKQPREPEVAVQPRPEPEVTEVIPTEEVLRRDVCIVLPVRFDFDRTEIKDQYEQQLARLAEFLEEHPEISRAEIAGHADAVGTESYNQELSRRRAHSVQNYLVENYGIDPELFKTRGYGESRPIAPNATAAGRQLNRRAISVTCYVEEETK